MMGISTEVVADNRPMTIPSSAGPIGSPFTLLEAFVDREYDCYDGISVRCDSVLRPEEIAISVMVNSQISGNTARAIWEVRAAVEAHLQEIPPEAELSADEAHVPWGHIEGAIAGICHVKRAKLAVATKILHKKRPSLIPMVDSVIFEHYRPHLPRLRGAGEAARGLAVLKLFRTDLMTGLPHLRQFETILGARGRPLTICRILEILLWVTREPRGYYRATTSVASVAREERSPGIGDPGTLGPTSA